MLAAMLRRQLRAQALDIPDVVGCSYEEVGVRAAVLAYVVGEGHAEESIFELTRRFSPSPQSAAVEGAVRDLVGEGLLTIASGKVVPLQTDDAGPAGASPR